MAPEYTAVKYRIPIVKNRAVFLCTSCGVIVEMECLGDETDVYESSDGKCQVCQVTREKKDPKQ